MLTTGRVNFAIQDRPAHMIARIRHWGEDLPTCGSGAPGRVSIQVKGPVSSIILQVNIVLPNYTAEVVELAAKENERSASSLIRQGRSGRPGVIIDIVFPHFVRAGPRMIAEETTGEPEYLVIRIAIINDLAAMRDWLRNIGESLPRISYWIVSVTFCSRPDARSVLT